MQKAVIFMSVNINHKNSGFGNFFVRNSLLLEFLHQSNRKRATGLFR